ncbi:MAG: outer membrane beta-barrel protein [Sphingobium sp.]|nr:outer membrane beta-barrel protein [Sphingobium sp.]
MKRVFAAVAVASALIATPALAQEFAGAHVGAEIGLVDDDFAGSDETTYGFNAGYDWDLGRSVVGVKATYIGIFDDNGTDFRELALMARAGVKATPRTLVYGTAGYSNLDAKFSSSIDGFKVGVGLEQSFGNVYANIETRYGNYEAGAELYQTAIGIGYRF